MATPKRITKELAEANKKKLQVLRLAGYNIKIDGSWGPWLELLYNKIMSRRSPNLANMGVMALPVAGYGAALLLRGLGTAQLLKGLGSVSLPSISIPSVSAHAMAAPVTLTLAGPVYGAYELYTGLHHLTLTSPQGRQEAVYAPDATKVNRPIAVSFPVRTSSELIGERYINPVLSRKTTRGRYLTEAGSEDDTGNESLNTDGSASTENILNSENEGGEQGPENKDRWSKLRERIKKLTERNNDKTSSKHPILKKIGKGTGYTAGIAVTSDIAGNAVRTYNEPEDLVHQWKWPATRTVLSPLKVLGKWWYDAYAPDSIDSTRRDTTLVILLSLEEANPVLLIGDTIIPKIRTSRGLVTTSTPSQLDSINKAWFGE